MTTFRETLDTIERDNDARYESFDRYEVRQYKVLYDAGWRLENLPSLVLQESELESLPILYGTRLREIRGAGPHLTAGIVRYLETQFGFPRSWCHMEPRLFGRRPDMLIYKTEQDFDDSNVMPLMWIEEGGCHVDKPFIAQLHGVDFLQVVQNYDEPGFSEGWPHSLVYDVYISRATPELREVARSVQDIWMEELHEGALRRAALLRGG